MQPKMVKALSSAMASEPDDWILLHLLFRKMTVFSATPEEVWAYEEAKELLEKQPSLECFRLEIQHAEGRIKD
jgi:hypothetical protein